MTALREANELHKQLVQAVDADRKLDVVNALAEVDVTVDVLLKSQALINVLLALKKSEHPPLAAAARGLIKEWKGVRIEAIANPPPAKEKASAKKKAKKAPAKARSKPKARGIMDATPAERVRALTAMRTYTIARRLRNDEELRIFDLEMDEKHGAGTKHMTCFHDIGE